MQKDIEQTQKLVLDRLATADAKLAGTLALARSHHLYVTVRALKLELQNIGD